MMEPEQVLEFLHLVEQLKCQTRHCQTSGGRTESVAEHCYRLAVFAWLLQGQFPDTDMNRVIRMCLLHDIGEAVTGDIPVFLKTGADETTEMKAVEHLADQLSPALGQELRMLFMEMDEQKTSEARLWKALDKMEAVIQHNESDISTWLPLEYDLQREHGIKEAEFSEYTKALREIVLAQTEVKIQNEGKK